MRSEAAAHTTIKMLFLWLRARFCGMYMAWNARAAGPRDPRKAWKVETREVLEDELKRHKVISHRI